MTLDDGQQHATLNVVHQSLDSTNEIMRLVVGRVVQGGTA